MGQGLSARVDVTRLSASALVTLYDYCTHVRMLCDGTHASVALAAEEGKAEDVLTRILTGEWEDLGKLQGHICRELMKRQNRLTFDRLEAVRVLLDWQFRSYKFGGPQHG